jgi:hypothetical protein
MIQGESLVYTKVLRMAQSKKRKLHSSHNVEYKHDEKHSESPNVLHDQPPSNSETKGHAHESNGQAQYTSVNGVATVSEEEEEGNGREDLKVSDWTLSQSSPVSGKNEEVVVFNPTRMLRDPAGRLRKFMSL